MISATSENIKLTACKIIWNRRNFKQITRQNTVCDSDSHRKTTRGVCTWLKFTRAHCPQISLLFPQISFICQGNKWQNNREHFYKRAEEKFFWSKMNLSTHLPDRGNYIYQKPFGITNLHILLPIIIFPLSSL